MTNSQSFKTDICDSEDFGYSDFYMLSRQRINQLLSSRITSSGTNVCSVYAEVLRPTSALHPVMVTLRSQ